MTMADPQKPHMVLGGEMELTFENAMTFFEKLKGEKAHSRGTGESSEIMEQETWDLNPNGTDTRHEQVTIGNSTGEAVDLEGWKLIDKAGNVYLLSGRVEAGKSLVVTMTAMLSPSPHLGKQRETRPHHRHP